jgi:hypothetical protein
MVYYSLALNVLFYESKFLFPVIDLLLNNIDTETSLRSFEMYHLTFRRKMVLRSKFAYEHIVCSMSRVQKISCGNTGVKMRWRRMPIR